MVTVLMVGLIFDRDDAVLLTVKTTPRMTTTIRIMPHILGESTPPVKRLRLYERFDSPMT